MKVWVLVIDEQVCGVFKNAEALDNLYNTFDQKDSTGYFGTFLLDWEISVTESELS